MKNILSVCLCLWSMHFVHAQDFTVNRYTADIFLKAEGYFTVEEHYDLTFHSYKHGIYRDIQLRYDLQTEDGTREKRTIKVDHIKVPGRNFETSGKICRELEGDLEIKIGDKHRTIKGSQAYDIHYQVANAFLYETNATQFYWNLKPPGWDAPFEQMEFRIHLPEGVQVGQEQLKIYSGSTGTTTESTDFTVTEEDGVFVLRSKEGYTSGYGESVTVLLSLPTGSIQEHKPWWPFGAQYGWTFIMALIVGSFYAVWRKHGKDDKVIAATSYYPPKGMDPAMAGFIIDDTPNNVDLMSLIPYWGAQGLITITEVDKKGWFAKDDIQLNKLKPLPQGAPSYERTMFNGLFSGNEVLVSSLKNTFYKTMQSARSQLRDAAQPYYVARSRKTMYVTAAVLIGLMIVLFPIMLYAWNLLGAIFVSGTCLVLLFFNTFMIKKNPKGNEALSHLRGFREFVKLAEARRLEVLLKEDPRYFEDTMAYAMAFGMLEKWADKFQSLQVEPPSWYTSSAGNAFTMYHFSRSFSNAMTSAQSTMVSSPSSSGGGSSGGGFGGGGGGSW